MSASDIWILEDDQLLCDLYEEALKSNYSIRIFQNLKEFDNCLQDVDLKRPKLLIADILLEGESFLNALSMTSSDLLEKIPFLVVSGIDDVESLRRCFKLGALDYLTKPFRMNELMVKIENIFALAVKNKKDSIIGIKHRVVKIDGTQIENLTFKQMQLLSLFINSDERTASREDILEHVWGGVAVHPKTIDVHLYNLRRKIHEYGYLIRSEGKGRWTLLAHRISSSSAAV